MGSLSHHIHRHLRQQLFYCRGNYRPRGRLFLSMITSSPRHSSSINGLKLNGSSASLHRRQKIAPVRSFDGEAFDFSPIDDWAESDGGGYVGSSSDGEDSDGEYVLNPLTDDDLPTKVRVSTTDAITVTTHRLGMIGRGRRKRKKIKYGVLINVGLIAFLTALLLFIDWCAWKIVRLPLAPFYLSRPFFISAVLVSFMGYFCVPLLNDFKIHQIIRRPFWHYQKRATPTMGGLFFVPVGVVVAKFIAGSSSAEVSGAAVATLAFAAIGFLDDVLTLVKNHNSGLPAWIRLVLEAAVGISFSFWLDAASISTPYSMYTFLKLLVPLPAPLGLVFLGRCYILLTSFSFVSMGNLVDITDGLDGLAGGTAALAFIGMSIAVLPICSELAIFGASMAGACVGFLLHNRYKASVFMGDTGSLALGGALGAMAACSGMFFPLFISSGVFVFEASSVIMQVLYFKATKHLSGVGRRLFLMAPFHYHLELCGLREPIIVAVAYVITCILALFAGYVGLISA